MEQSSIPERTALVDRAKAIILTPKDEWPRIAAEPTTRADILKSWVLPLAAIGPVARLIGEQVFGYGAFGFSYKPSLASSLASAIIGYGLTIAGVFVLALIVDFLAPKFNGTPGRLNAFKLAAYGATAAWIAGIFGLIPMLGVFALLGIYSLYLFYTGVTPVMAVPADKAGGFTAATFLAAFVLYLVVALLTGSLVGMFAGSAITAANSGNVSGMVTVPGVGAIDLDKAQDAAKRMEDAANGKTPPIDAARMQELLPPAIGGYERTATESLAVGAMGSTAQGTYTSGTSSFTLKVADMSALGALAGLGAAMGVEQTKEDANGFERTTTVNGQMQTEKWNRQSRNGKFGVVVGNRFLIEAEGTADSLDDLKAAVGAIDQGKLADLAG